MKDVKLIISDADLDKEFVGTSFGDSFQRDLVKWCLMKKTCDFSDGGTITRICQDLKLLGKTRKITKKGKHYLWAAFHEHYNNV